MKGHRARAFTLIEILVVVAILIILMALLLPALSAARQKVAGFACLSHLRQIGQAATMYRADNDDWYPIGAYNSQGHAARGWDRTWHDLLLPYLDNRIEIFYCPQIDHRHTYRYSYGCNRCLSPFEAAAAAPATGSSRLIYAAETSAENWPCASRLQYDDPLHTNLTDRHQGKVDVLFCDSHVQAMNPWTASDLSYWIPTP
jgi:prepilin-type processing-associated H-X9-DG protein